MVLPRLGSRDDAVAVFDGLLPIN